MTVFEYWTHAKGLTRLYAMAEVPSEAAWGELEMVFRNTAPNRCVTVWPGCYLLRGVFVAKRTPELALARVRATHDVIWLTCEPRIVHRRLAARNIGIPPGPWHAVRGAMLVAELGP